MEDVETPSVKLWLDSGAFSVWKAQRDGKQVKPIVMSELIDYYKSVEHLVECLITFDVMPKAAGRAVHEAAKASYNQHQVLKAAGLAPMPVFHQGEDISWLQRYVADGERYIGLSPLKGLHKEKPIQQWCDLIFGHYTDVDGRALVKFHGLGVMQPKLLVRYPWFSVDSTSWSLHGGFGNMFVPAFKAGKPDFSRPPLSVPVSGERKTVRQFEKLNDNNQQMVVQWLGYIGTNITECRNVPDERRRADIIYFEGLRDSSLHDVRFKKPPGFRRLFEVPRLETLEPWTLTIVYATVLSPRWSVLMNGLGAMHQLLSYNELRDEPPNVLENYVMLRGKFSEGPKEWRPRNPKDPKDLRKLWKSTAYTNYRKRNVLHRQGKAANEQDGQPIEGDE